jgi:hypothetical protein
MCIRWDPFILRAQPLDTSLLSLCWHNKTLHPANGLKSSASQLANSRNISWGLIIRDCCVITSLFTGVHPPRSPGGDPTRHQWTAWYRGGIHPPGESGWGSQMHSRTQWGTGTSKGRGALLIRLVRTLVQIQACPRRQKGSLITSQWDILVTIIFGVKSCLSFREQYGSMVLYERIWKCDLRSSPAVKWVRSFLPLCVCLAVW